MVLFYIHPHAGKGREFKMGEVKIFFKEWSGRLSGNRGSSGRRS
jgi:hypothetical protein